MATINPQIDAAVVLMKARAAEFDDAKTMGPDETDLDLMSRAESNIARAVNARLGSGLTMDGANPSAYRHHVLDCMNLCALALTKMGPT